MAQKHELKIHICLADFDNLPHPGRTAIEQTFKLIEQVKAAVFAKGGRVHSFTFDNTPTRELNPCGDLATLSFDVRTPYDTKTAELDVQTLLLDGEYHEAYHRVVATVEFKFTL